MNKEFANIDDLLGKYLAGEASEQERYFVADWLKSDDENVHYFNQLKTVFDKAAAVKEIQQFDTDAAWNKVKANLKHHATPVIPLNKGRSFTMWYRIAAAVVILFGVAWYLFLSPSDNGSFSPVEVVAESRAISDTLPNGTNVFLNKQSKVVYAFDKANKTHEVKLKGEAYFNIKNSKQEDFIVNAGEVFIRDIGTSFNVKAYPGSDEVEVLVEEGEVMFFTAENPGISLKASGKGVYNKKTKTFTIEQPEPNITAYKTKFFVFSGTDLRTVAETLNKVYDKQVVIPRNLENCTITVSFREESIEEITAVVAETLGLTLDARNNQIVLQGDGCQ